MTAVSDHWLRKLGYAEASAGVISRGDAIGVHPYAPEIDVMLDPDGEVRAAAVVCVEDQPTVCIVEVGDVGQSIKASALDAIRQRVWNQGLVSIVLVVSGREAQAAPARFGADAGEVLTFEQASERSAYSWADISSGDIQGRHPDWFAESERVDQTLLANLASAVDALQPTVDRATAQYVLGQSIFVSYLEHRGIVGDTYRSKHRVGVLRELVESADRAGLTRLLTRLKSDLNGDILPAPTEKSVWTDLPAAAFGPLRDFLEHTSIASGQKSFWHYDFRYIPVELLSGIYETFLSHEKNLLAAFYTPRNLAVFTVALAFEGIADPTNEVVYDGACGSGILLTTAFRRILRFAESRAGRRLVLVERTALLLKTIRGSDISEAACRVTAFSLYLALMEDLDPPDIERLRTDEGVKLPQLRGSILRSGKVDGDFFSPANPLAVEDGCTIFISNPPWKEPKGRDVDLSYEHWLAGSPATMRIAHRQIAMAFAHKANAVVKQGGKACLILPSKAFVSRSSQDFLRDWLKQFRLRTLVNFSDLRRLLFPAARHPCMVVMGSVMCDGFVSPEKIPEFNYWVPKADISLAFGRLTLHSSDRHRLRLTELADDNECLRIHTWGTDADRALITELKLWGSVADFTDGRASTWRASKGFHLNDASRTPFDPVELRRHKFFRADRKPSIPVLHADLLLDFPETINQVASIGGEGGTLYSGPRVIFPDGAATETFELRAFYSDRPFSFQSSVGAFGGPEEDADLLRFFAVYLHSSLARYFLLHTSYSLAVERERISLRDVKELPFVRPEAQRDVQAARLIVKEVAELVSRADRADPIEQINFYESERFHLDQLIYRYFNVSALQQALVEDAVSTLVPSVQPTTIASVRTPYNARADLSLVQEFAITLQLQLDQYRDRLGGTGHIGVSVSLQNPGTIGPMGICAIDVCAARSGTHAVIEDTQATQLLHTLTKQRAFPAPGPALTQATADLFVIHNDVLYVIRPLLRRFWLQGQAMRTALDVIRVVEESTRKGVGR